MNHTKQELEFKKYLKAAKRLDKVRELLEELPLRKLKEPVQSGWVVDIKLRDDISRRKDAETIKEAIALGYNSSVCIRSLNWLKLIRQGKKFISGKNSDGSYWSISFIPNKKSYTEEQYSKFPQEIAKYFSKHEDFYRWNNKVVISYKINIPDYWIKLRSRPNILTHQRIKGGELETEEKKLEDYLHDKWQIIHNYKDYWGVKDIVKEQSNRTERRMKIGKILKGELQDY